MKTIEQESPSKVASSSTRSVFERDSDRDGYFDDFHFPSSSLGFGMWVSTMSMFLMFLVSQDKVLCHQPTSFWHFKDCCVFIIWAKQSKNKIVLSLCTEALWLFELSGAAYLVTELHDPEGLDVLQHCNESAWFQASATKQLRTAIFWVVVQWVLLISYHNLLCSNLEDCTSHLLREHQIFHKGSWWIYVWATS
jgi:hypothetical protein